VAYYTRGLACKAQAIANFEKYPTLTNEPRLIEIGGRNVQVIVSIRIASVPGATQTPDPLLRRYVIVSGIAAYVLYLRMASKSCPVIV